MRTYVILTGVVFGLLVIAHSARVMLEGWHLAANPGFVFTTVAAAALSVWAARLAAGSRDSRKP